MVVAKINVDKNARGQKLVHYWDKCVGSGRAYLALREDYRKHLIDAVKECGFKHIRFHGIFHDDMMIYHENSQGVPFYNWQYLDGIFDFFMEIGVKPFVEFGFMPSALASGSQTCFYWKANVTPPKDYDKWSGLIHAFALHCKDRYGIKEIESWYWEIWNEPTLRGFWSADMEEYFKLYEYSVKALKRVSPNLKVGGPASHNFRPDPNSPNQWEGLWIKEFLGFCHAKKLPVDFVSAHPYPTDFPLDEVTGNHREISRVHSSLSDDIAWLLDAVKNSPFPFLEIHLTEWNSSPSPRDFNHDHLFAASFIIEHNINNIGKVNSLSYWTFSDVFEEQGAGNTSLHGGFGLINLQGLWKPAFHGYRFLHGLGSEILARGDGYIVTKDDGELQILLWNYVKEEATIPKVSRTLTTCAEHIKDGNAKEFEIKVSGFCGKVKNRIIKTFLSRQTGSILEEWVKMGGPISPTKEELALLKIKMMPQKQQMDFLGETFTEKIVLKGHEVAFIEMTL